jgi:uncharacterized protein
MEQRVTMITLGVADLVRAVSFYEHAVGWTPSASPPGIAFFDLGGLVLGLYPNAELAREIGISAGSAGAYHGFTLSYNTRSKADVDAIFSALREHGATILREPQDVFWGGYSGYFGDPDGHAWEVAYNPHWTLRPDGRVSMERA